MATIVRQLALAAQAGAELCAFPELALTGFHRQIKSLATTELVSLHFNIVANACAAHGIATAVGTPTFDAQGRNFNSYVFIDAKGETLGTISKNGLTPPEATFFAPGDSRPIFNCAGARVSSFICREVEDVEEVCVQLPIGSVELLLWPGAIRPAIDSNDSEAVGAEASAREIARRCQTFVVQANWPNSLNYPEESEFAGQSIVINPHGETVMRLPRAQVGVAVFELGAREFEWVAM